MKKNKKQSSTGIHERNHAALNTKNKTLLPAAFCAAAIVIITYIVFVPSLKCGFTNWDDNTYIQENSMVANNSVPVKEIFQTPVSLNYHPLTILTLAWNFQLGGLDPQGYHSWNVWLHVLNTILVFIFIFLLTQRNVLMASIVALFFGIHPMHVESVTWISERKDVLYVFFFLAGLIAYLYYRKSQKAFWYLITLVLFILSCLSKAMAVVFPVVLLLIDYLLHANPARPDINKQAAWWKQKIILEKIPFFLLSLGFGIAAYKIQQGDVMSYTKVFSLYERIGFASYSAIMYIVKLIIPYKLSALYPYPRADLVPGIIYWSPVILICSIAVIYLFMRKERSVVFGFLFYFVSVALVLQFISVGNAIMADRYSYLSSIGLLFIVAHLMNVSWQKKQGMRALFKYPLAILLLSGAIIFSFQTYTRTQVWINSETLWTDVINKYPATCYLGYRNRADYYLNVKHDDEKTLMDYNKALEINPTYTDVYYNRGVLYGRRGQDDLALIDYTKAVELNPNYSTAYNNRGTVYDKLGKYDSAMADYNKTLELDPGNFNTHSNRGIIYYKLGKYDSAMSDYNKALELNPTFADVYDNRGVLYAISGKHDMALADFSKAIELNSAAPLYWLNRSRVENALGKKEEAKADAIQAQQLGIQVESAYLNELGINK